MRPPIIISSHRGRIGVGIVVVVVLLITLVDVIRSGLGELEHLPPVLLVVWVLWMVWGVAEVRINDHGVDVVNQFRIWEVPWSRLIGTTGRWGLSLTAQRRPDDDGQRRERTISAWAAPARGTATAMRREPAHLPEVIVGTTAPLRCSLDSHGASRLIEFEKIERLPEDEADRPGEISVHPNWLSICVTVVLAVATVIVNLPG